MFGYWYQYRSKDKKTQGYCPGKNEAEVAHFASYPVEELVIERIRWNGKELVKCQKRK